MGVSVVIPARNEAAWLPGCLDSLARQSRAPDEIIVVDNGSTDGTTAVALAFGCTVVTEPVPGVGRARYRGCGVASSEIVAMTDADTHVPDHWIESIIETFQSHPECVALTGPWRLFDGRTLARWCTVAHGLAIQRTMAWLAPPVVNLVGCNSAFRAAAYRRVGGFRPDLKIGEDLNLSLRLRAAGRVCFVPGLVVHTSGRRFERSFLGGMGQYLPDATRQVCWYLLGRREVLRPSYEPVRIGAGAAGPLLHDGIAFADAPDAVEEMVTQAGPAIASNKLGTKTM